MTTMRSEDQLVMDEAKAQERKASATWHKRTGISAVRLVDTHSLSREDWLAARRKGIGGSDIGAICRVNPWRSPTDVYLDKIGESTPEPSEDASERMRWGTLLEDVVAREFAEREGVRIERVQSILQDPAYPQHLANLDRIIYAGTGEKCGILEVKVTGEFQSKHWDGDKVPDQYMLQMQWYFAVTGLRWGVFATLVGGRRLITKRVERDDELIAMLEEAAQRFWLDHVEKQTPPPVDGSTAATELLARMYPESNPDAELDLPLASADMLEDIVMADSAIRVWEARKAEAQNKIKEMMQDAERARVGRFIVSWKTQSRSTVDTKALRAAEPTIAERYTKVAQTRVFTVKQQEQEQEQQ